ncbi:MAG TPA: MaoC family dehydratase N-terminal domain-containing protein [Acidimicrobiia bacterium]|nr:MaoC family dehydratase N-terminal domain-containing protein [Acidimicrobiia bacterium]
MAVERFPVEAGHILMFARSIGDQNPIYADAEYAAGTEVGAIPAPPTFVQASAQFDPEYFLRPHPDRVWHGSGREATGMKIEPPAADAGGSSSGDAGAGRSMAGGLHAEQHYEYHRPLVAGDVLRATVRPGERWEKQGRSGKLSFSETITEYRDLDGNLVVTARSVGVGTEGPKKPEEGTEVG